MQHNFRELNIWREAMDIAKEVYAIAKSFPDDEKFGLTSQIKRCAISIVSNIAEGSGRTSNKEFTHFLNIALSSSYELETQLLIANDLFDNDYSKSIERLHQLQKMIGGFKRILK